MTFRLTWLLCLGLFLSLHAQDIVIDYANAAAAKRISIHDNNVRERWKYLFNERPVWPGRHVAFLTREAGDNLGTLFAARLLYPRQHGPWRNNDSDPIDRNRWIASDRDVRLAILREIRLIPNKAWVQLLGHVLAEENDPALIEQCLLTLVVLDPAAAAAAARRLSMPGDDGLGQDPEGRTRALRILVGLNGPLAPTCRDPLICALSKGQPGERLAAITLLPNQGASPLLENALPGLAKDLADQPTATAYQSLINLIARLDNPSQIALTTLATWCQHQRRDVLCAAAAALGDAVANGIPGAAAVVPGPALAERLRSGNDEPAARAAMATLLLRSRPDLLIDISRTDLTPWHLLAEHRLGLARWDVDRLGGGR